MAAKLSNGLFGNLIFGNLSGRQAAAEVGNAIQ